MSRHRSAEQRSFELSAGIAKKEMAAFLDDARRAEFAGASRFNTSAHLNRLVLGGLVARRREGSTVYYRVDDENLPRICATRSSIARQLWPPDCSGRILTARSSPGFRRPYGPPSGSLSAGNFNQSSERFADPASRLKAMSAFEIPSRLDIVWTNAIGDPALVVDTTGIVVSCNKEAAWLLGRSASHVIGRRCAAVVRGCLPTGELICTADCPLVQGWAVQSGPPAVEMLVPRAGPHSERRPVVVHHIPVRDIHGRASGVLHILKPSSQSTPNNPGPVTWSVEVSPPGNHLG